MNLLSTLALLFLTMVVQVIIPPLPAELIVIGAGRVHGVILTTLVAGSGLFAGSIGVYYIGRYIHLKLSRFFDRQKTRDTIERIKKIENIILWIRILPYNPSDIISYAAGIVEVPPTKFFLITACTSYTRTFLLAHLGTYITNLKTLLLAGSILIISALVGAMVAYGGNEKKNNCHRASRNLSNVTFSL